jgi:hypothetical protein
MGCAYSELSNIAVLKVGSSKEGTKNQSISSSSLFVFFPKNERKREPEITYDNCTHRFRKSKNYVDDNRRR